MFQSIIEQVYLGNRVADYLIFVGLFLAGLVIIKIFQRFILRRLKKWAEKTTTTIDDFFLGIIQR
ncbi:MAG: mechanosensitive ion channel family protein, partial [Candidatus Gorgyraea atricola]|nr:mechanosensitive ion channel family protein [Candidatus Gorgyraea atricola]